MAIKVCIKYPLYIYCFITNNLLLSLCDFGIISMLIWTLENEIRLFSMSCFIFFVFGLVQSLFFQVGGVCTLDSFYQMLKEMNALCMFIFRTLKWFWSLGNKSTRNKAP